ncbi:MULTISPECIES: DUF308 domain-containing protein [unclassified Bradyrhizobium]|uniref:DUF308 domain-containing protein n=1 Tax=unclassified Bradyrhizobium TaxID=2631580 RepID=UPI001BA96D67|nr:MULTISPECIES: DUF308 domain-containing protein [unclassified Bradyrhizobium]MBR1202324.1 DUF308 domain-containing protein [Bradyrhizobium sp. AUGA SZCCT0124]MBR1311107.1 DUF308 domain-containing protein [Bradyrhizobium sp. AUGA SZCCT0051]MBR1339273.1 DUF308 domain-containing protein [Bradyrhizobium sp. AUGA SZCCT0105]MBR1353847.1 DUF308 domain-containing protein [Bradyrhizobium sp. AUGA SZCCT0045]
MMVGLLIVGVGLVVAGLAAIGLGIPYKEFSVGGALITTGVTGVCTGVIVLALAAILRELQVIASRLDPVAAGARAEVPPASATSPRNTPEDPVFPPPREPKVAAPPPPVPPSASTASPPWHDEIPSRGAPGEVPPPVPGGAPPEGEATPKRRNLLFSSSRKERERAQSRTAEPLTPDLLSPELRPDPAAAAEPAPATFDDAWPKAERPRSVDVAPRRTPRPSTFGETQSASAAPSSGHPPPPQEQPPVTVLKSGVVDGMAYSLYSDGSIEAQMPEGMMRFASIDELRSHLEQRP